MTTRVVKMSLKQWEGWLGDLGTRFQPAMKRGLVAGAARCVPILQRSTRNAPPASPKGKVGAFNTGALHAGWASSPLANGSKVFNRLPYSPVVEGGRRPSYVGRRGRESIEAWARRKLKLSAEEAKEASWAIAKTLKERPLKPRRVMGSVEKEMIRAVEQEITHELDKELRR